jgi:phosphoribosylglycinamide formyltransferase-1
MKKLLIITGSELRHEFFRKYISLSGDYTVIKTYCESEINTIKDVVDLDAVNPLRKKHLLMRDQSEKDFFQLFCSSVPDHSNPEFIKKGDINLATVIADIIDRNPDIIVCYGCSIIRQPLINAFAGKIVNVHLGLSPYYRGSGTNFWPFVNNEPQYAGVTFMYMNSGVDTGEIIHQMQATIQYGDNIHQVGNRLIGDMAACCRQIIEAFDELENLPQTETKADGKYYRNKDFSEDAVAMMYRNFSEGLVENYLGQVKAGNCQVPIKRNPALLKKNVFA